MCRYYYCTLYSGLLAALFSVQSYADHNVDISAVVTSDTCQLTISHDGIINLGAVGLDYFADGITAETDYQGGKNFTIDMVDCPANNENVSQIIFDFTPQSGQLAEGNNQIFSSEYPKESAGADNIGVVIFSTQGTRENVLNSDGTTRATYALLPQTGSSWMFYSRMQKIADNVSITPGLVSSRVLVNVTYK